jgi:hypothetical protein
MPFAKPIAHSVSVPACSSPKPVPSRLRLADTALNTKISILL